MPPGGDTHFRIASITKTMTSAVIVLMAQEGKLQFSDPVSKYVPNVPNGENITIAQLLKMRSGLYGYANDPKFAATLDEDPTKAISPQGCWPSRSGIRRSSHPVPPTTTATPITPYLAWSSKRSTVSR